MQTQISNEGRFATPNASRYLQQLCKHFAHKIDVEYTEEEGRFAFPSAEVRLEAAKTELVAKITSVSADGIKTAQNVIDSHLERFAFREGFKNMDWSD
ncbi:DUF2218 domain-containing protein [Flavimaricola marinus]|uniref:2,4-dihydroxyhept-2-ene-1,7-dioic acid aldolase n=1 Tax=Flavimaricola marinus TaxID=1819565 RepID=A0A238LED6_9RHOB|nr:DUF2218 domain-containing protein [Flavimaricola marinus]SMY07280.1 hypothetical protein LOM8899_01413 [Flavimaricola marinus]